MPCLLADQKHHSVWRRMLQHSGVEQVLRLLLRWVGGEEGV